MIGLIHFLTKKFQALAFEVLSRIELLGITISYLHENFKVFASILDELRTSLGAGLKTFVESFGESRRTLAEIDDSFKSIDQSFRKSVQLSEDLSEDAKVLMEATGRIDNIAADTHTLAINAAIQAARAGGPAGEAFAVIASEVRRLALSSQETTKEVTGRLDRLSAGIEELALFIRKDSERMVENRRRMEAMDKAISTESAATEDLEEKLGRLIESFESYDQFRNTLTRMLDQSQTSRKDVTEMMGTFSDDLSRVEATALSSVS